MDIILKEDVNNLGNKDDIVTVKNGYAQNYLIPKGYATIATASARKMVNEVKRQRAHKEEKQRAQAEELAQKIEGTSFSISTKTSSSGKIFGSVTNLQIAEKLQEKGFEVERKNITIDPDPIKEVGKYKATVKLFKDIKVDIDFEVASEE